jgi:hypothetical protein
MPLTDPRPAPPAGTARVAISGTVFGHALTHVFWYEVEHSGTVVVDDLDAIAAGTLDAWASNFAPLLSTAVVYTSCQVVYFPTAGTELVGTATDSVAGEASEQIEDASASIVVDWLIALYYRGGKPRSYLPGPDASKVSNGSDLNSTYLSDLAGAASDVRNGINAGSSGSITAVTMGTVSFEHAKDWRDPPIFVPYINSKLRPVLASQRRRITS